MISWPLTLYWLPSSSVSGQVSQTQTSPFDMSGKSCGTVGHRERRGHRVLARAPRSGPRGASSWRASARVHFAVKSSSGAYASCVWTVGSGPGCRSSGAATAPAVPVRSVATSAPAVTIPPMSGRLMRRVDVDMFVAFRWVNESTAAASRGVEGDGGAAAGIRRTCVRRGRAGLGETGRGIAAAGAAIAGRAATESWCGRGARPRGPDVRRQPTSGVVVRRDARTVPPGGWRRPVDDACAVRALMCSRASLSFAMDRPSGARVGSSRTWRCASPDTGTYAQTDNVVKPVTNAATRAFAWKFPDQRRCRGWSRFHGRDSPREVCKSIWSR